MRNVHVRPVRDLRNNYAELARLLENHDQIIITSNGRGAAVLMNIDEYAAFEAYTHERYIADKLQEAEAAAGQPDAVWVDHDTVWAGLKKKYGL